MAYADFLQKNVKENLTGKVAKGFIAFDVANLALSENKFKAIRDIIRDVVFNRVVQGFFGGALFLGMTKAIRTIVRDTGSLDAALRRLSQIQTLRSLFAPLVGGVNAAKTKVAELQNFAASKKLNLGDAAEAARQLQVVTKGGFSGVQALEKVADAAEATGNSMVGVANAAGDLHAELESGASISGTVEQLRQMGVVTQDEADKLDILQESGASASTVFDAFNKSLDKFSGGAKQAADNIDHVNAAYEAASANLQVKFGSAFVESDVQNTKNYTDAMLAVAPAVERVSSLFSILSGGFSNVKSGIVKAAAENAFFRTSIEGVVYALTALVTVGGLIGGVTLGTTLFGWATAAVGAAGAATTVAGAFGNAALAAGLITTGVGAIAATAIIAAGVMREFSKAIDKSSQALLDFEKANNQASTAISTQISTAKTLTEQHDALAAALDREAESQDQLNKARKESRGFIGFITGAPKPEETAETILEVDRKNVKRAKAQKLGPGPSEQDIALKKLERDRQLEEAAFQQKLQQAPPEQRSVLLGKRSTELAARAKLGAVGDEARIAREREQNEASRQKQIAEKDRKAAKNRIDAAKAQLDEVSNQPDQPAIAAAEAAKDAAESDFRKADNRFKLAEKRGKQAGANAPTGTSVALEQQKQNLLDNPARDEDKLKKLALLNNQIAEAKFREEARTENDLGSIKASVDQKELDRQIALDNARLKTEKDIGNIKEEGFARTEKEIRLRLHLLDIEEAAERARGEYADKQNLSRIAADRARQQLELRQQARQTKITKGDTDIELATQKAQLGQNAGDLFDERPGLGRGGVFEGTVAEAHGQGKDAGISLGGKTLSQNRQLLGDFAIFKDKFKELLGQGFEQEDAARLAKSFAGNAVSLNANKTDLALNSATVADSLQRIGGGGEVYAPGGADRMVSLAERQIQLQELEVEYLKYISGGAKEGVQ